MRDACCENQVHLIQAVEVRMALGRCQSPESYGGSTPGLGSAFLTLPRRLSPNIMTLGCSLLHCWHILTGKQVYYVRRDPGRILLLHLELRNISRVNMVEYHDRICISEDYNRW